MRGGAVRRIAPWIIPRRVSCATTVTRDSSHARKAIVPLQTTHILYRILFSALILLSLLWLALSDWPTANFADPSARLDSQCLPAGTLAQTSASVRLRGSVTQ